MKHRRLVEPQHATGKGTQARVEIQAFNSHNPGNPFLRDEIETNRKSERILVLKGIIALVLVAILVTIRQVFFV